MSVEVFKKEKGVNFGYRKYKFTFNSKWRDKFYWCCLNPSKLSQLVQLLILRKTVFSQTIPDHKQLQNKQHYQTLELRQNFLKKVDRNPLRPVCQKYENVTGDQKSSHYIKTFSKIKSKLYRYRNLQLPKSPRNIRSIGVTGQWARTLQHDRFYLKKDRNWRLASNWQY